MDTQKEDLSKLNHRFGELIRKRNKSKEEMEEKEKVRLELEKQLRLEASELLHELKEVGLPVSSVYDLVNTSKTYKEAIPILIKHLSKPYHRRTKEGIVRALAVKEAVGIACKAVIDEYHKTPKEKHALRWAFGNTMSVIITKDYMDDVIEIVLDETQGESRDMFVRALGKLKFPKVKEVLQKLLEDKNEVVKQEATRALKKFK